MIDTVPFNSFLWFNPKTQFSPAPVQETKKYQNFEPFFEPNSRP